jgi:hypothetical protein
MSDRPTEQTADERKAGPADIVGEGEGGKHEEPKNWVSAGEAESLLRQFQEEASAEFGSGAARSGPHYTFVFQDVRAGNYFKDSQVNAEDVIGEAGESTGKDAKGGRARRRARRIPLRDRDRIVGTHGIHVAPPQYGRAKEILHDRHLVVLTGRPHYGKWTSALHLALSLDDEDLVEEVVEMPSTTTLEQLCDIPFGPRTACVVGAFAGASALVRYDLDDMRDRLERPEQGSYLLITVDGGSLPPGDALGGYQVDWGTKPRLPDVLERHLTWHLAERKEPNPAEKAAKLVADAQVRSALEEIRELQDVADLAELLVERWGEDLGVTLGQRAAKVHTDVANWFHEADLQQQSLMISLAVLDGSNYGMVAEKAEALFERIEAKLPPPPGTVRPTSLTAPDLRRTERLRRLRANLVPGYEDRAYGRNRVRLVMFQTQTYKERILRHVWEEHDVLHGPILEWLHNLARDQWPDVRREAASVLGRLATFDFDEIIAQGVQRWANDGDKNVREAAARALFEPFRDRDHETQALQLLDHWSHFGKLRERWTAAAAYGAFVGYRYPHEALQGLQCTVETRYWTLVPRFVRSLTDLFGMGFEHQLYSRLVLEGLVSWTTRDSHSFVRSTSLLAFLNLTTLPGPQLGLQSGPALLWLAHDDEAHGELTGTLWLRALDERTTRRAAVGELRRWFTAADDRQVLQPLLRLLIERMATAASDDELDRLCYYLDRWASDERMSSTTAALCLQGISRKEGVR